MWNIRKFSSWALRFVALCFVALAVYEGIRVWQASQVVNAVFAPYSTPVGSNPKILYWAELLPQQQNMLLKIEDPTFFSHKGLDLLTDGAGLTTITQAITKRLFFKEFRPGFRKLEQSLIAWLVVSPNVAKEVQLTAFLNVVYLGRHAGGAVFGFDKGSDVYFGKSVETLYDDEFLRLVGALIAPRIYPPIAGNELSDRRLERVKRYIAGDCVPTGLTDVSLEGCK